MHQITNQFIRSLVEINLKKKIYFSRKFILKNFSKSIFSFCLFASYSHILITKIKLKESYRCNILRNDIKIVLIFNFIYIYI